MIWEELGALLRHRKKILSTTVLMYHLIHLFKSRLRVFRLEHIAACVDHTSLQINAGAEEMIEISALSAKSGDQIGDVVSPGHIDDVPEQFISIV
jgi:hypothetical protein